MTCTDFLSKLTDYFDGQISPALLDEVRDHVSSCHHCEVVLDTTRQTIEVYRNNEVYSLSTEFQERLHGAIMKRCREGRTDAVVVGSTGASVGERTDNS